MTIKTSEGQLTAFDHRIVVRSWLAAGASSPPGIGVNFWRHYLLVTPKGQVRIFFNSGTYGTEQMYSLVPR
jgi:hypothetical protein